MKLAAVVPFVLLLSFSTFGFSQVSKSDAEFVNNTYYPATALLYSQDEQGSMKMRCTGTFIEKNATGYVFVTAAHCGCEDDAEEHTVTAEKTFFFVTIDDAKEKRFLSAKPIACGYRTGGDDFFELQIDTTLEFPVIPLGHDPANMDSVVNVADPMGIGKQVFIGNVSAAKLDRPMVEDDINWTHAILLQLFGTNGGSSGSSIICLDQKAVCGFVVGTYAKTSVIAMPVSRLIKMREQLAAGKYKHWVADPDAVEEKKPELPE